MCPSASSCSATWLEGGLPALCITTPQALPQGYSHRLVEAATGAVVSRSTHPSKFPWNVMGGCDPSRPERSTTELPVFDNASLVLQIYVTASCSDISATGERRVQLQPRGLVCLREGIR